MIHLSVYFHRIIFKSTGNLILLIIFVNWVLVAIQGNFLSVHATYYLGMKTGFPLTQTCIVMAALWGILYFKEIDLIATGFLGRFIIGIVTIVIGAYLLGQSSSSWSGCYLSGERYDATYYRCTHGAWKSSKKLACTLSLINMISNVRRDATWDNPKHCIVIIKTHIKSTVYWTHTLVTMESRQWSKFWRFHIQTLKAGSYQLLVHSSAYHQVARSLLIQGRSHNTTVKYITDVAVPHYHCQIHHRSSSTSLICSA